ncbi:hypothetical protein [uncultured Methylobacterium sp.]|jgi:hypothetical protein|uniref:hypothetical protein n=1 Tax=uncultured Methylobacterium sp. TaxID=157278 RepID=UPI00261EF15F|nr:hypothetical protein [uncultured Methylobacterium sp.]
MTKRAQGRLAPRFVLCRACNHFVRPGARTCAFCEADMAQAEADYESALREALEATAAVERLLFGAASPDRR